MVLRLLNRTRSAEVTMLLLAVHFGRFVWQGKSFYRESSLQLSSYSSDGDSHQLWPTR